MRAAIAAVVMGISLPGDVMPPEQYRSSSRAIVITASTQAEVDRACGKAKAPHRIVACAKVGDGHQPYVIVPNPCRFAEQFPDQELYAAMLCHELAHTQGWRHSE